MPPAGTKLTEAHRRASARGSAARWLDDRPLPPKTPPARPGRMTKEQAPCCLARRDRDGRLPVGFCAPDCLRRPVEV